MTVKKTQHRTPQAVRDFPAGKLITKQQIEAEKERLGYTPGDSTAVTRMLDGLVGVIVPKGYTALREKLMGNRPPQARRKETRGSVDLTTSPENQNASVLAALPDTLALRFRGPRGNAINDGKAWARALTRIVADIDKSYERWQTIKARHPRSEGEPYGFATTMSAARGFIKSPKGPLEGAALRRDCLDQLRGVMVLVDYLERIEKLDKARKG